MNLFYGFDSCFQRTSVVVIVEGVQQRAVFANQSNFCGSRAGINTQKDITIIGRKVSFGYSMLAVIFDKCIVFILILKKWIHPGYLKFHVDLAG